MLRALCLSICVTASSAFSLGAARAPTSRRAATIRLQVPETSEAAVAAEDAATVDAGVVQPTEFKGWTLEEWEAIPQVERDVMNEVAAKVRPPLEMSAASQAMADKIISKNPALGVGFRRAEFWSNQTCTVLEVLNVLGRFETSDMFRDRTIFTHVVTKEEDDRQSETYKRYVTAQKLKCTERVGMYQNLPHLPFTNEKIAKAYGLTCDDFNALDVTFSACNLVFDALAESRSGLIPYDTFDGRRAKLISEDGTLSEFSFRAGLWKSRSLVTFAWFLFGKGQFVWVIIGAETLHNMRPDIVPTPVEMGLFKMGAFI